MINESPERSSEPWIELEALLVDGKAGSADAFLSELTPAETARAVSRLDPHVRTRLLMMLSPEKAVQVLLDLPHEQVADLMEQLPSKQAAAIVLEMPGDEKADILTDVHDDHVEAILAELPREDALLTRRLLNYPEHSAGALMHTEYLAYPEVMTVGEIVEDLQRHREQYTDYYVQYAYITSDFGRLLGILRLRDLLFSPRDVEVKSLMLTNPLYVPVETPLDDLIQIFEDNHYLGLPVTDFGGRLLGVVNRDDVMGASGERDKDSFLKASGIIGGEELRTMPLWQRSGRRLSWLSINIVLNIAAASVIALYQDTLSAVIALAVFLPIISDMSGSAGSQAVAVSIRELTIGLVKPYEVARVVLKEVGIGVINGILLGILLGAVAYLWKQNIYLSAVVGGALALNTVLAVCLGGAMPLLLKKMKMDPALASVPILTTVTDMCGFFLALSFAAMALAKLG
jgi:magnesium transporter